MNRGKVDGVIRGGLIVHISLTHPRSIQLLMRNVISKPAVLVRNGFVTLVGIYASDSRTAIVPASFCNS